MTINYKMGLSFCFFSHFPQQTVYKWSLGHVSPIFIINIIIFYKAQTKNEKLSFVTFIAALDRYLDSFERDGGGVAVG